VAGNISCHNKKIIVDGLKNNIILDNKECVVGLSVCLPSHLSGTKLFVCTKFSGVYMCTVNMRLINTKSTQYEK
jgi:hypothetical protein